MKVCFPGLWTVSALIGTAQEGLRTRENTVVGAAITGRADEVVLKEPGGSTSSYVVPASPRTRAEKNKQERGTWQTKSQNPLLVTSHLLKTEKASNASGKQEQKRRFSAQHTDGTGHLRFSFLNSGTSRSSTERSTSGRHTAFSGLQNYLLQEILRNHHFQDLESIQ